MTEADVIAIQYACATSGRGAALAEIRCRCPLLNDARLEATLERILTVTVAPPARFASKQEPHRDTPGVVRSGKRCQ